MNKANSSIAEADPSCFRVGDVWESPRGQAYRVSEARSQPGKRKQVRLVSIPSDGSKPKSTWKDWDAIGSIDRGQFWVRLSWGGEK